MEPDAVFPPGTLVRSHSSHRPPLHFDMEQRQPHHRHRHSATQASHVSLVPYVSQPANLAFPEEIDGFGEDYPHDEPKPQKRKQLPRQRHVYESQTATSSGNTTGNDEANGDGAACSSRGKFPHRYIENPPNLTQWRQRLFDLEETVILDQDQFSVYFPWVDNVYSHRSTQGYKRKSFITHYWDCRLKGRPPGTTKSNDPNKKKRKRVARERNQCDVKIKITQYRAGAASELQSGEGVVGLDADALTEALARIKDGPFWTIQRINGNGANSVGDSKPSTHRHTLDRSDEIKKSSVQRWFAGRNKNTKRTQKPIVLKTTGLAAATAKKHFKAASKIQFYAACFWYENIMSCFVSPCC